VAARTGRPLVKTPVIKSCWCSRRPARGENPWRPVALGLCLLALGALPGCRPRAKDPPPPLVVRYQVAIPLAEVPLRQGQSYLALIHADKEKDLSFKVSGVLELIGQEARADWEEGSQVNQGEVLARLQQADFTNAVQLARANADLDQSLLERISRLRKGEDVSEQEVEVLAARRKASQATLAQAEQALRDSELRAPFTGCVLARLANSGETVMPGRPVLRFGYLGVMSVELGVPDRVISRVRVGQEVPLSISALEGASFTGRVAEVGVAAKESTRLFKVVLKVDNPQGRIKSGMTASVAFPEDRQAPTNAVLVPLSALVAPSPPAASKAVSAEPQRALAVFVLGDDGRAHERLVQTGDIILSSVVITSGVRPGEKVVVVGASTVHEGALVEARPDRPSD
jgi:RND family efflux transporter MFP subunit